MYMAPEQVAGDPSTDHRADIYAFGCMAYEMLTGAPPFSGKSPQQLLTSQMVEVPRAVTELRPDTPPALADLVMRSLEKNAAARPQSAAALVAGLDSVTTPGGAPRTGRAFAVYAFAFAAVWIVAKAGVVLGLPAWVVPGTLVVMAMGLPVILVTAFRLSPWMTWRRATFGGVAALGVFALLVVAYMSMRALGIGPVASLQAMGTFSDTERVVVADFKSPAADSSLGPVVTDMFKSDLADSKNLIVVQPAVMRQVLRRLQRSPNAAVDLPLARAIATSEGVKAVIDGEVLSIAGAYVINATLYATQTGEKLATFRATARDSNAIIAAIDRLSRDVRTKAGESLRNVNAALSLERVTTPSFEALKKYIQAVRAFRNGTEYDKGFRLLDDAVAIDSGFSMAWRKMAVETTNRFGQNDRSIAAIEKAYAHRDRLSELERDLTTAAYYYYGPRHDDAKAIAAYEAALDVDPHNATVLNNLSVLYVSLRELAKGENLERRSVAADTGASAQQVNLLEVLMVQGKLPAADTFAQRLAPRLPDSPDLLHLRVRLASLHGQYDSAEALLPKFDSRSLAEGRVSRPVLRVIADLEAMRGRLRDASRARHALPALAPAPGAQQSRLTEATVDALMAGYFRDDTARALRILDSTLATHLLDSVPPLARPLPLLAEAYAVAGRADRVRAMIAKYEESHRGLALILDGSFRAFMRGQLAMAESRYLDAARDFQASDSGDCGDCTLPFIAHAYDLAGMSDSAIAVFTRFTTSTDGHTSTDPRGITVTWFLAGAHKRLGELLVAKGDVNGAVSHYQTFVELWRNADAELQPKVVDVRRRLEQLRSRQRR